MLLGQIFLGASLGAIIGTAIAFQINKESSPDEMAGIYNNFPYVNISSTYLDRDKQIKYILKNYVVKGLSDELINAFKINLMLGTYPNRADKVRDDFLDCRVMIGGEEWFLDASHGPIVAINPKAEWDGENFSFTLDKSS